MLKTLIKKQLSEYYSLIFMKKNKPLLMIGVFVLVFFSLGAAFFGMGELLASTMIPAGLDWLYFALMGLTAILLGVVGSAFSAYSLIYNAKDNNLLLSMPIPPWMIIFSRTLILYLTSFLFVAVVFLPTTLVFWLHTAVSVTGIIFPVIMIFLLSLFVLCLSLFLGWVVGIIASRVKNRTVGTILAGLAIAALYYFGYFKMNEYLKSLAANATHIAELFKSYGYPCLIMGNAAAGDAVSFILLTAFILAVFAVVYFILSKTFVRMATRNRGQRLSRSYSSLDNPDNVKAHSHHSVNSVRNIKTALLAREFKHFISSPAYMLNQGISILFFILGAVILLIKRGEIISVIEPLKELLPVLGACLPFSIAAAVMLLLSVSCITSPSISLEGSTFWLLVSLPIKPRDILHAKEKMHIILVAVPALIFIICAIFSFALSAIEFTEIAVMTAAYILFSAKLGINMNLKRPNFSWTSETVVVKQSASVGFSLLISFLATLASTALFGLSIYVTYTYAALSAINHVTPFLIAALFLLITYLLEKKNKIESNNLFIAHQKPSR